MIKKLSEYAPLSVAGLGFLVAAAYVVHTVGGLAATGIALLLLEWRLDKS